MECATQACAKNTIVGVDATLYRPKGRHSSGRGRALPGGGAAAAIGFCRFPAFTPSFFILGDDKNLL